MFGVIIILILALLGVGFALIFIRGREGIDVLLALGFFYVAFDFARLLWKEPKPWQHQPSVPPQE